MIAKRLRDTLEGETSGRTHRPTFMLIFTDSITCCFKEASVSNLLNLTRATNPLPMHVGRLRVSETRAGNGPFFRPVYLLGRMLQAACQTTVTVTSDGRKAAPNDITLRGPLFLRNQTHPHRWRGKLSVIETRVEEGTFVSFYPLLARDHHARYPPQSSSSLLRLSVGPKARDILYSLHFWPTSWDNGFQILQGGPCMCQTWKWKANTSPPPSVST